MLQIKEPEEDTSILAFHDGMALNLETRHKRQVATVTSPPTEDQLNETNHIRNEHHGMLSQNYHVLWCISIELLYAF